MSTWSPNPGRVASIVAGGLERSVLCAHVSPQQSGMPSRSRTRKTVPTLNTRMAQPTEGGWRLRVWNRAGRGRKAPRLLIRCGCCEGSLKVFYASDSLEINGVEAPLSEWRAILGPLLQGKSPA